MLLKRKFNKRIFFYVLGMSQLFLAVVFILSMFVSFVYRESSWPHFLLSFAIAGATGGLLVYFNRNYNSSISKKDGRLIVGLAWVMIPVFGCLPFAFDTHYFSLTNALFESYSGFTTTGATTLKDVEAVSKATLFYRSFIQWVGGLGFSVFIIMFVRNFRNGTGNLFNAEFNSIEKEKDSPHIDSTVFRLFFVYSCMTVACFVLLLFGDMTPFEALCHSLTTIPTGGFSVANRNMAQYDTYSQMVVMCFMFLTGMSYFLFFYLFHGKWKKFIRDDQLRMYLSIIFFFSLGFVVYFACSLDYTLSDAVRTSLFYVVSVVSSCGFDLKVHDMGMFSTSALILLMFIGGCSASSSTGLKIGRVIVLLKYVPVSIKRILHPRAIIPVRYNGKPLRDESVNLIFGFFFLFLTCFIFGAFALSVAGNEFMSSLALSAANISNVGPIMGNLSQEFSYADLNMASKYILIVLMMIGRLEIYAFFAIFSYSVWSRN